MQHTRQTGCEVRAGGGKGYKEWSGKALTSYMGQTPQTCTRTKAENRADTFLSYPTLPKYRDFEEAFSERRIMTQPTGSPERKFNKGGQMCSGPYRDFVGSQH